MYKLNMRSCIITANEARIQTKDGRSSSSSKVEEEQLESKGMEVQSDSPPGLSKHRQHSQLC